MNAIVLLLAVAILLCFAFGWDTHTHHLINQVIVETYTTNEPSPEPFIYKKYRLHDYEGCSIADLDNVEYDEPVRVSHKHKSFEVSHNGKGATLHTYRVKGFSNKVLHPCK